MTFVDEFQADYLGIPWLSFNVNHPRTAHGIVSIHTRSTAGALRRSLPSKTSVPLNPVGVLCTAIAAPVLSVIHLISPFLPLRDLVTAPS